MKSRWTSTSLRARVALVATAALAAVLLLVGAGALTSFAERENQRIDERLQQRPAPDLARALDEGSGTPLGLSGPGGPPVREGNPRDTSPRADFGPRVLRPREEYVRLVVDGEAVREIDTPDDLAVPDSPGLRTVSAGGVEYRSLTRSVGPGALVEIGLDLSESQARVSELRDRLLLIGLAGVLLVAALSWWLAGLALRPLSRLGDAAGRVSGTADLSRRINPGASPSEVEELTESINSMLSRLEASADQTEKALEATRRFAGDAGHELRTPMTSLQANLGAIRRNPDIDADEMEAALEHMDRDAARMMRMLSTLQTLARGDSAAVLPRDPVELTALLGNSIESARRRHPEITWQVNVPPAEVEVEGWPDGIRALIDNLLENAARHGKTGGAVSALLESGGDEAVITVDDDGPGIPADRRDQIFERFDRGDATAQQGSGLGLSLVRQQALLHGGEVTVSDSPSGGARFQVTLRGGVS
jgi:two-component system sensor histidine kinase PrrB